MKDLGPSLWQLLRWRLGYRIIIALVKWESDGGWSDTTKVDHRFGCTIPRCDEPITEGMFAICFRGHPYPDPFQTSSDGIVHGSPFFMYAGRYGKNDEKPVLPRGYS